MLLAGVPLAVTLAVALPLAERHLVALAEERGELLILVEVVRWVVFGVALGELLPLDAAIHQLSSGEGTAP